MSPVEKPTQAEALPNGRDIWEVANQLSGYVDMTTPADLASFLLREAKAAEVLAQEVHDLRLAADQAARTTTTEGEAFVCARCKGARSDLQYGREPEELCDPCYNESVSSRLATPPATPAGGGRTAALFAELQRQCGIGAGSVSVDPETGLWRVSADLDPAGLRAALDLPAQATPSTPKDQ